MYSARREPRFDPARCGKHQCDECGEYFRTAGFLDTHKKRIHRRQSRGECALCNLGFESCHFLKKHIVKCHDHLTSVPVRCSQCGRGFINIDRLNAHISVHMPRGHQCRFCEDSFLRRQNLLSHEAKHLGSQFQLTCPYCFKTLSQTNNLITHIKSLHAGKIKSDKCPFCAKTFPRSGKFKPHVDRHLKQSTSSGRYSCSFCLKIFPSMRSADEHCTRAHSGADFKCTVCDRVFEDPRVGVQHVKSHQEVDSGSTQCPDCGKEFEFPAIMLRHRIVHHPDVVKQDGTLDSVPGDLMQDHTCTICGEVFVMKSQCSRHIRKCQSNVKRGANMEDDTIYRLLCLMCDEDFLAYGSLRAHYRKSHPSATTIPDNPMLEEEKIVESRNTQSPFHEDRPKIIQCSSCQEKFGVWAGFVEHIKVCSPVAYQKYALENEVSMSKIRSNGEVKNAVSVTKPRTNKLPGLRLGFTTKRTNPTQVTCPVCSKDLKLTQILPHIGSHTSGPSELFLQKHGADITVINSFGLAGYLNEFLAQSATGIEFLGSFLTYEDSMMDGVMNKLDWSSENAESRADDEHFSINEPNSPNVDVGSQLVNSQRNRGRNAKRSSNTVPNGNVRNEKCKIDKESEEPPFKKSKSNGKDVRGGEYCHDEIGEKSNSGSVEKLFDIQFRLSGNSDLVCETCSENVQVPMGDIVSHSRMHCGKAGVLNLIWEEDRFKMLSSESLREVKEQCNDGIRLNCTGSEVHVKSIDRSEVQVESVNASDNIDSGKGSRVDVDSANVSQSQVDSENQNLWSTISKFLLYSAENFGKCRNQDERRKFESIFEKIDSILNFRPSKNSDESGFRLNFVKIRPNSGMQAVEVVWCWLCHGIVADTMIIDHLKIHSGDETFYLEDNETGFSAYNETAKIYDENQAGEVEITQAEIAERIQSLLNEMSDLGFYSSEASVANERKKYRKLKEILKVDVNEEGLPFTCLACRCEFNEFHQLCDHVRLQHMQRNNNKVFYCNQCSKVFQREGDLKKHLQYVHKIKEELGLCPVCQSKFENYTDMGRHMTAHKVEMGIDLKEVPVDGVISDIDAINALQSIGLVQNEVHTNQFSDNGDTFVVVSASESSEMNEETGLAYATSEGIDEEGASQVYQCSECDMTYETLEDAFNHVNSEHQHEEKIVEGQIQVESRGESHESNVEKTKCRSEVLNNVVENDGQFDESNTIHSENDIEVTEVDDNPGCSDSDDDTGSKQCQSNSFSLQDLNDSSSHTSGTIVNPGPGNDLNGCDRRACEAETQEYEVAKNYFQVAGDPKQIAEFMKRIGVMCKKEFPSLTVTECQFSDHS